MKIVVRLLTVLLSVALLGGCIWMVWFSVHAWRDVVNYDRHTLSNYDEVVAGAVMLSVPPAVMIVLYAAMCAAMAFRMRAEHVVRLRRICSWALFAFSASIIVLAVWFTLTSHGQGAGYIVFLTGPMVLFALVVPMWLGFIVARKNE